MLKFLFKPISRSFPPHTSPFILLTAFLFCTFTSFAQGNRPYENPAKFVYQSSVSIAYGVGNIYADKDTFANNSFSFEVQQLVAYQFNHYFYTGAGAGLDFWFYDNKMSVFVPVFANITAKFVDKKMAPFLYANIGYAFKWQVKKKLEEDLFYGTKAGIYFQVGFGLNLKISEKISILLSPYYRLQQSANQYRESELLLSETSNQLFHFVGVKIGLLY
ncbi:MAG: hypothetical protein FWD09_07465 [Lentimicrobiaceae bacterium]|nr:hypothetical protein [Lentimicrobiaceae bacterium]